nr:MAG TPA: ADP-ribosylation factor family protein [Caudoviricetes sp.]
MTAIENIINQIENETRRFGNTKTRVAAVLRLIKAKLVELFSGKLDKGRYTGTADDLNNAIGNKVDKVPGKGLSTNDFTNTYKQRLDNLEDYDIELDENTTELRFKRGSNVVRRISLMFLDDEGTKLVYNKPEKTLELRDKRNNLLTSIPVSHFVSNIPDGIIVQNGKIKLMAGNNVIFENAFSYNDLADKPDLNFAPASHRHNWDDIDGKPDFNYLPTTGGTVNGDITANSIIKKNSSNDKVLLGGGGEKSLSELDNKNIQIGGRNLILNSKVKVTNSNYDILSFMLSEEPKEGEQLTITLKGVLGAGKSSFVLYNKGGFQELCILRDKGNGIYQQTFNWKKDPTNPLLVVIYVSDQNVIVNSTVEWIKLERGNAPTDWSPAPEDIRIATEISGERQVLTNENIVYVTANTPNCDLQLIRSGYSVAFRKVFAGGQVTFTCTGKTIIYTGDNVFNGGDGSTAVVSIWKNKCYIDIRNI